MGTAEPMQLHSVQLSKQIQLTFFFFLEVSHELWSFAPEGIMISRKIMKRWKYLSENPETIGLSESRWDQNVRIITQSLACQPVFWVAKHHVKWVFFFLGRQMNMLKLELRVN